MDSIEMNVDKFNSNILSNKEIVVTIDNYFNVDSYSNRRKYNGKVKNRLVFREIAGELKIISESDDLVYYTNINF